MLHRASHDTQRAQPTLRLHSSRFVVESCDVFVGNRTLFEQFGSSRKWFPTLDAPVIAALANKAQDIAITVVTCLA